MGTTLREGVLTDCSVDDGPAPKMVPGPSNLSQSISSQDTESDKGSGQIQPSVGPCELQSSSYENNSSHSFETESINPRGSQKNTNLNISSFIKYHWDVRGHGLRIFGHIVNMLEYDQVKEKHQVGNDFLTQGVKLFNRNNDVYITSCMSSPKDAQWLREPLPGGLPPREPGYAHRVNQANSFLTRFNWYIRVDIAGCFGPNGTHDLLLRVADILDGFCEHTVKTASKPPPKLSFWPTLFVRCGDEAKLSRGSRQDCGTLLIGIDVVEYHTSVMDESDIPRCEIRRSRFLGCNRLGTTPSDANPCPEWERHLREILPQVEDTIRDLAIFRWSRGRSTPTSVMIRIVHPHQLEPLSCFIPDQWIWPTDRIFDRVHTLTYERISPSPLEGYLVIRAANFLQNIPSYLGTTPAPDHCRPFQIVAQIAMKDPNYAREWMRLLLGYFDAYGYNEVTLETWWAIERRGYQNDGNGFCPPKHCPPWGIVSIRRHKTLELLWHLTLKVDRFPRVGKKDSKVLEVEEGQYVPNFEEN